MIMFRTKRKEELQILEHSTQFPPRKKTIQSKVPASQYAVMNGSRTQECASTLSHLPRSQADSALCSLAWGKFKKQLHSTWKGKLQEHRESDLLAAQSSAGESFNHNGAKAGWLERTFMFSRGWRLLILLLFLKYNDVVDLYSLNRNASRHSCSPWPWPVIEHCVGSVRPPSPSSAQKLSSSR